MLPSILNVQGQFAAFKCVFQMSNVVDVTWTCCTVIHHVLHSVYTMYCSSFMHSVAYILNELSDKYMGIIKGF